MPQKTERAGKLFESKLRFWLRMALVVAYSLMLNSMLNNMQQMNTDAIAYMRVAEYWSSGNLGFAVNGYWGPMLSWLMVPFLWLGVEPFLAGKLAMLISSAIFFHGSLFLVRSVGLRLADELVVAWVLALTIPGWMSSNVTPDLLVAGLMAFALGQAVSPDWLANRRRALGTGATWGLAYFAKAVALLCLSGCTLLLTMGLSLGLGWALFDTTEAIDRVLLGYLVCLGTDLGLICLSMLASSFVRSVGGVVVLIVLLMLGDLAARGVLTLAGNLGAEGMLSLIPYFPGSALDAWEGWKDGFSMEQMVGLACLVLGGFGLTSLRFTRMDVP